ncbi:HET-domain-containing protein [Thozetella sp. PMI_491]|nr:HET-domain-containing protein [Thozetella sp. PMI_491]
MNSDCPSAVTKQYRYFPLPSFPSQEEGHAFRLLTLRPGVSGSPICLDLEESCIGRSEALQYEALSYVWGPNDNPVTIQVGSDDRHLRITRNLFVCLEHLRFCDRPRVLWIDALCINQEDIAERSHQVAIMGKIYRCAAQVLVWLGREENNSRRALEIIKNISSHVTVDWSTYAVNPSVADSEEQHWSDKTEPLPFDGPDRDAVGALFHREWFERLWIRQEIILARDAIMQCGLQTISWGAFRSAVWVISRKDGTVKMSKELQSWISSIKSRIRLLYHVCTTRSSRLVDLRYNFGASLCQDPRDRIYAILSMLEGTEASLGIIPDYSRNTAAVYQDAVVRHINLTRLLNILLECESTQSPAMPTWVPDWSVNVESRVPMAWLNAASGPLMAQAKEEGKALWVVGRRIDKVQSITAVEDQNLTDLPTILRTLQHIIPDDAPEKPYPASGTLLEAFVRTLLRDYVKEFLQGLVHQEPSLSEVTECLRVIVRSQRLEDVAQNPLAAFLAGFARDSLINYDLFTTCDGYLGLGPKGRVKPGDSICALLGCDFPMVLRPSDQKGHLVIGKSYLCGWMYGEAFLGPLPPNIRLCFIRHESSTGTKFVKGYRNWETGSEQYEDPRLDRFGLDLTSSRMAWEKGEEKLVDLSPDALRSNGIECGWFQLV